MACDIYCLPPPLCPPPSHPLLPHHPAGLLVFCGALCALLRCGRHPLGRGHAPGGRKKRTDGNPERRIRSHLLKKQNKSQTLNGPYLTFFCQHSGSSFTCVEWTGGARGRGAALASASCLLTAMTMTVRAQFLGLSLALLAAVMAGGDLHQYTQTHFLEFWLRHQDPKWPTSSSWLASHTFSMLLLVTEELRLSEDFLCRSF